MDIPHIPTTHHKRIIIIGGGFAGLKLAQKVSKKDFQVVLIDKNNLQGFGYTKDVLGDTATIEKWKSIGFERGAAE